LNNDDHNRTNYDKVTFTPNLERTGIVPNRTGALSDIIPLSVTELASTFREKQLNSLYATQSSVLHQGSNDCGRESALEQIASVHNYEAFESTMNDSITCKATTGDDTTGFERDNFVIEGRNSSQHADYNNNTDEHEMYFEKEQDYLKKNKPKSGGIYGLLLEGSNGEGTSGDVRNNHDIHDEQNYQPPRAVLGLPVSVPIHLRPKAGNFQILILLRKHPFTLYATTCT
jgi:hypothetical protein